MKMKSASFPLLILACATAILAQQSERPWQNKYFYVVNTLASGDSAAVIGTKLDPPWVGIETNSLVRKFPFKDLIPYTNIDTILEWHSRETSEIGWPLVIFAVFSDSRKTNLTDALLYSGGDGVQPIIEGPYNKHLLEIHEGDSMGKVFQLLGSRRCRYFKVADQKYHVTIVYQTKSGDFLEIEADAGSGIVIKVTKSRL